jgi:ABC-type Fe3+ transport system substrate-binding protein
MRRYVLLILFAVVLLAPFVLRQFVAGRADPTPRGARFESQRLVIVTPHNQDIRKEFAVAFNEWHERKFGTRVEIDYRNVGGTNDIRKLIENSFRGLRDADGKLLPDAYIGIDIVWGGGDFFFNVELDRELGVLQRLELDPALLSAAFPKDSLAGVRLREVSKDQQGNVLPPKWVGCCLSSFGIVYNPDLYARLNLSPPTQWADLAKPELANLIALADPTRSGSAAVAYMMVLQRAMADAEADVLARLPKLKELSSADRAKDADYRAAIAAGWKRGMGQLVLIAANARYFTDSANLVPKDVSTGDAAAGMAIDFYGRTFTEIVGPGRILYVSPAAATAITPDPIAVLHGVSGDKKTLANRFVEFQLSPEGQRLWILKPGAPGGPRERGLRRPPVRPDVYADRSGWTDDVNPFEESGGFNQRGDWMALFTDTRPIWAAAWIDTRESLKRAYRAVLSIEDATRRDEMLAKLADLPISMADVEADNAERKRIEKENRALAPESAAERRLRWATKFREHYRAIERAAREEGR